jgi:hypothetical protein
VPPWQLGDKCDGEIRADLVEEGREQEREDIIERETFADGVRGSEPVPGRSEFSPSRAVRLALVQAQWADSALAPTCHALSNGRPQPPGLDTELSKLSLRGAGDGALEALVAQSSGESRWVVVVPQGEVRPGQSWRAFLFSQSHVGVLGGHRNEAQTLECLRRIGTWPRMAQDVSSWIEVCWACIQYRRKAGKVLTTYFVSWHRLPWHHVLVDFEGPITPADRDGGRYSFTYTCLVCYGSFLAVVPSLAHTHVRRALTQCVLRSSTFPELLGHDGGPPSLSTCSSRSSRPFSGFVTAWAPTGGLPSRPPWSASTWRFSGASAFS